MVALEVGKRKGKSLRNVKAFNFSTRSSWLIAWLGFPDGSVDKESATMQETPVQFLGQEDPLEKG